MERLKDGISLTIPAEGMECKPGGTHSGGQETERVELDERPFLGFIGCEISKFVEGTFFELANPFFGDAEDIGEALKGLNFAVASE